jgi:hypothetical protein
VAATQDALRSGPVSRQSLKESLSRLSIDFGGYSVKFSANNAHGSAWVDLVGVGRNGQLQG